MTLWLAAVGVAWGGVAAAAALLGGPALRHADRADRRPAPPEEST